jgi:hypothetical protein
MPSNDVAKARRRAPRRPYGTAAATGLYRGVPRGAPIPARRGHEAAPEVGHGRPARTQRETLPMGWIRWLGGGKRAPHLGQHPGVQGRGQLKDAF